MAKIPHPAETPAQREVLDRIGHGISSPPIFWSVKAALLKRGLIEKVGEQKINAEDRGPVMAPVYDMPPHIYVDWCAHWTEKHSSMDSA